MSATRPVKRARRKAPLGQNFLTDAGACRKIVDALGSLQQELVVEIGPGRGAITHLLVERARQVVAIELDRTLAARLRYDFRAAANIEIIEADVLQVDLDSLLRPFSIEGCKLVGNLPYYITSEILLKLFRHHGRFSTVVVMVQREVGERLTAQPGSRTYGLLTVSAQLFCDVEALFTLPPGAFTPAPKVRSMVLRLTMASKSASLGVEPQPFLHFLRLCFAQKRKTLANNLKPHFDTGEAAIRAGGARSDARAEALTLRQLAQIYKALHPLTPGNF
jgi:16S rRNA (adenine1518-N6/adenine1519-N6)-dimethyltransferase